jgi:beta-galactosidase
VVAWEQIPLSTPPFQAAPAPKNLNVPFQPIGADWVDEARGTSVRVDGQSGWLNSFRLAGREYLRAPLSPNFWRVPTDNDNGWKVPQKMGAWKDAVAKARLQSFTTNGAGHLIATVSLPVGNATVTMDYSLREDGILRVELHLKADAAAPELPRVGVQFAVPGELNRLVWYGRGPQENYWDRKSGAAVGLYRSTVGEWITPYVRPQENANRTDVRWIDFAAADGAGLRVKAAGEPLGVSAWPYSAADLAAASHDYQLPRRDFVTVNLDAWQMGVGGDNSWGLPVHPEYRMVRGRSFGFAFDLCPLGNDLSH